VHRPRGAQSHAMGGKLVNKKRVRELKRGTPKVTKPLINSIPQP